MQGAPKPMSDCPGQVEIQFGQVNLWHNLSVGQAHFKLEKIQKQMKVDFKLQQN